MIKITIKNVEKLQENLMGAKGTIVWIDVPVNVRQQIVRTCKKFQIQMEPSPLHITLFPIQNSDDEQAAEEVRRWAASAKPMKVQMRGVEYFDNDNGTVSFVGVDCDGLEDFVESLAERLEKLGMQPILFEQFVPHITIQTGMEHWTRLPKEAVQELEKNLKGRSWTVNRISFSTPEIETNFKMANQNLIKENKETLFHVGKIFDGDFSLDFLGTGEKAGFLAQGPGIYFSDTKKGALFYQKYHQENGAALYECRLKFGEIIEPAVEQTTEAGKKFFDLLNSHKCWDWKEFSKRMGLQKAVELMQNIGVVGIKEQLGAMVDHAHEFCIFNTKAILVVNKTVLSSPKEIQKKDSVCPGCGQTFKGSFNQVVKATSQHFEDNPECFEKASLSQNGKMI